MNGPGKKPTMIGCVADNSDFMSGGTTGIFVGSSVEDAYRSGAAFSIVTPYGAHIEDCVVYGHGTGMELVDGDYEIISRNNLTLSNTRDGTVVRGRTETTVEQNRSSAVRSGKRPKLLFRP